jgi:hypothetical protein
VSAPLFLLLLLLFSPDQRQMRFESSVGFLDQLAVEALLGSARLVPAS